MNKEEFKNRIEEIIYQEKKMVDAIELIEENIPEDLLSVYQTIKVYALYHIWDEKEDSFEKLYDEMMSDE